MPSLLGVAHSGVRRQWQCRVDQWPHNNNDTTKLRRVVSVSIRGHILGNAFHIGSSEKAKAEIVTCAATATAVSRLIVIRNESELQVKARGNDNDNSKASYSTGSSRSTDCLHMGIIIVVDARLSVPR